ncbi:MAG: hypothetical protein Kow00128_23930 [Deltaproteobacteria bacterium]
MSEVGKTIRRSVGILVMAAMVPAAGFAFGGPWDDDAPKGPPQEAIDACAGRSPGEAVRFTTPRGDTVSGACRETPDGLVAVPDREFRGRHRGKGPGDRIERMAIRLGLTKEQKERIRAILEAERERVEPLRRRLDETREKIRTAGETEPFDEAAIRALAASQNEARVELIVSRAKTKSRIHALLTPEQRERAKRFGPPEEGRHGHRPPM